MPVNDRILDFYRQSAIVAELSKILSNKKINHCFVEGVCGSLRALTAAATALKCNTPQLFILPDKESAAYFYHDLEQLLGEENADIDNKKVVFLPDANFSKSGKLFSTFDALLRIKTVQNIHHKKLLWIVSYHQAVADYVSDEQQMQSQTMEIALNEEIILDNLIDFLNDKDFQYNDFVAQPGDFALRGNIVDIFSYTGEYPYRVEFNGDKIASLRTFDLESQLSKSLLQKIIITPNLQKYEQQVQQVSIFEILPPNTTLWFENYEICYQFFQNLYKNVPNSDTFDDKMLNFEELLAKINAFSIIDFGKSEHLSSTFSLSVKSSPQMSFNKQFEMWVEQLFDNYERGICNFFCYSNDNQAARVRNIIRDILKTSAFFKDFSETECKKLEKNMLSFEPIALHEGFTDLTAKIACFTDHQLFERYHRYKVDDKYRKSETVLLKDIYELQPGDYVTHIDHGIGRYAGLEKIDINGKKQEAIKILYKEGDILYISIHSMHRIAKYAGKDGMPPPLNRLGSNAWKKIKEKTKSRVKTLVFDLAKLYAERKLQEGFAYSADTFMQTELEASFAYEDTPDQLQATNDVKADMESSHPMDRLICGDVGFGKTEIAVRAAFKAVCDNKQVAVLVPTTVLALQHYNTFCDRLADFPCKIDYVNRFRTAKEQKNIIEDVQKGKIDIIIGTHRLLSKDFIFKDLGLIIIDEEQKFGVGDKERLRSMKVNVDTLTLTATPIPRTLQFSLIGARDISIMKTPPLNRYPIVTQLCQFSEELIKSAVDYELQRGGQVFFVHNRVFNIGEMAAMLQRNFPKHKIAVGHGKMKGEQLEKVMLDFMDGTYDILVCTTIVESGLDIPNANTIIINDAQNYGLSELHQLRGRVGRKNKKAFCYLLTPPADILPEIARKRLQAIKEFSDIGSGLNIAMRDLDIRGAGDLLGAEQSGFITEIGYEMYEKLLQEAIFELQQEQNQQLQISTPISTDYVQDCVFETDLELLIPDSYVSNHLERYQLYKALNNLTQENELQTFKEHLIDRFGKIPIQTEELIKTIILRNAGKKIAAEKLTLKKETLIIHFPANSASPFYQSSQFSFIINILQSYPNFGQFREQAGKLTLVCPRTKSVDKAIEMVNKLREIDRVN
ncbi:MAG: transcription-repair coupling factor [Bacteroidales bacterium]|jgi:transcription-repair coupling factor (superfamily II helicase)|nr:transcription-repair coupling factor [Bacteroidales bacterium]